MTLPGGVLLVLDAEWDQARIDRFFKDNHVGRSLCRSGRSRPTPTSSKPSPASLRSTWRMSLPDRTALCSPVPIGKLRSSSSETVDTAGPAGNLLCPRSRAVGRGDRGHNSARRPDRRHGGRLAPPQSPITWTAPSDVGSVAIVAYDLHYIRSDASDKSDSKWTEKQDIWSSGSLTYTIAGLRRDTSFDIQVRAVNSGTLNTDGSWSATKEGSTTDHGGSRSAATTLSLGSSLEGSIDPADDADYFRIVVPAATDLWVYTSGALDTTGELITSGGTLIAKNYDGRLVDHPLGFSIRAQRNSGTYYVKVTSHAGESTGAYQIHTEAVVAPGDTFGTAKVIELDSKAAGRIHRTIGNVNDTDMFKFELASNTEVWIVATTPFGSNAILYNESRSRISSSDNGGWTYNHRNFMIRRLLDVGTYFLKVAGDNALGSGPYALYLKTVTEGGSSQATATPLTLNVAQTGSLSLVSDREYFSFTLDEETYLSVYAASFGSGLEISVDGLSAMTESYQISRTDYSNAGIRAASFLKWGKLAAGAYNISTSPSTSVGGDYLLHVRTSRYGDVSGTCTATLTTTMSDPWYGCQWHLDNTDQFANSAGQDINVQELWDETDPATMGAGIRVAVVDDGMHFTHEDLTDTS